VIFCGPVRYVKVAKLLLALHQSRADNSFERELRGWLAPDLLVLDDFGLRKLTAQQSSDIYDVLVERDRRAATIITSNRAVDELVALFDDPILANSTLDCFAHRAHQIAMEGPSLRAARAPGPAKSSSRAVKTAAQRGVARVWVDLKTWRYEARRPLLATGCTINVSVTPERTCSRGCPRRKKATRDGRGGGMFLKTPGGMILKNDIPAPCTQPAC